MLGSTLFTSFALFSTTGWAGYVLQDDYMAGGFFNQFSFFDTADPTHGFVDYLSQTDASNAGLINETSSQVTWGVDSTHTSVTGRPSVRLTSNKSYSSGLVIVDIEHMPGGICGTWPAFWMVGPNWPNGGEIDIIEGVNDQTTNDVTLHTGPGCSVSNTGDYLGHMVYSTCESSGSSNNGCQIASSDSTSYGAGFNANKGGVYAMEWTGDSITVYFFPRNAIPSDVSSGSPNPSGWGTPMAKFTGDCNFGTSFVEQQIVFDTTFCGDWAGNTWASSSCAAKAATCDAYVGQNPSAFVDAYWTINALKVYESNGDSALSTSTYVATSTSVAYVTQPTAEPTVVVPSPTTFVVATSTDAPFVPVVGPSGSVGGSPSESGTGYTPVVGGNGVVNQNDAPAPAETASHGSWMTGADGALQYEGKKRDVGIELSATERHARHLRFHKRHGGSRL